MNKIKSIDIIKHAFELFFKNVFFITSIILILLISSLLFSSIQNAMLDSGSIQWAVFSITSQLFTMGLSLGFVSIIIEIYFGNDVSLNQLFERFDLVFTYLLASLIFAIIISTAMLPGIIILIYSLDLSQFLQYNFFDLLKANPETINFESISLNSAAILGIFIMLCGFFYTYIRFQFYQQAILYKDYGPWQAILNSAEITKNNIMELSEILLIILFINIIGAISVFGLLFSIPISMIAMIVTYFKLNSIKSVVNKENKQA